LVEGSCEGDSVGPDFVGSSVGALGAIVGVALGEDGVDEGKADGTNVDGELVGSTVGYRVG